MQTEHIYNYIERLSELLRIDLRQAGATHGLQPVQLEVLHYLSICNRYSDTPMAVTEYLGQTKGTVSQTIKTLEKKGLLSKKTDNHDKRMSHLKVTAKGNRLLRQSIPSPMFVNASKNLPSEEQKELIKALKTIQIAILQSNGMKSFGVCHSCRYHSKEDSHSYFCNLVKQPLSPQDINLICREHENSRHIL